MERKRKFSHKQFISPEEGIHLHRMDSTMYGDVGPHLHDFVELVFIRSGKGVHTVGGKSFWVSAGDAFVLQAGDTHSLRSTTPHFSWVDCLLLPGFADFDFSVLHSDKKYAGGDAFEIGYLLDAMLREYEEKKPGYLTKLKGYLLVLLGELGRHDAIAPEAFRAYGSARKRRLLARAVQTIKEKYREPLKLEQVADELQISKSYLSRLFRENLGTGFVDYVSLYRLELSEKLLRTTGLPIRHVALDCGFSDEKRFRTLFRKRFGTTPAKYRNGGVI